MNSDCGRIRELLSAHLDGELAAAEKRRVEEHLAECAECRAILAAYRDSDTAFAAERIELPEAEWERLATRVDEAIAQEALTEQREGARDRQARQEVSGWRARWRSLLGGISPRRLSLGALGSLAVAALVILLFPWREEIQVPKRIGEKKATPGIAQEVPTKPPAHRSEEKKAGHRAADELSVREPAEATVEEELAAVEGAPAKGSGSVRSIRGDTPAAPKGGEGPGERITGQRPPEKLRAAHGPLPEEARFQQLEHEVVEAARGGGVAEALAAAQAVDGFLTDFPASDRRLEALELAARVWVRLAEIDPARHCVTARERVRAWEAAAGEPPPPQMRELLQEFRQGPCAQ